jgi:hypothetical protein
LPFMQKSPSPESDRVRTHTYNQEDGDFRLTARWRGN